MEGICIECKEWTSLKDSCCGSGVAIEGSIRFLEEDEEDEEEILPVGNQTLFGMKIVLK